MSALHPPIHCPICRTERQFPPLIIADIEKNLNRDRTVYCTECETPFLVRAEASYSARRMTEPVERLGYQIEKFTGPQWNTDFQASVTTDDGRLTKGRVYRGHLKMKGAAVRVEVRDNTGAMMTFNPRAFVV